MYVTTHSVHKVRGEGGGARVGFELLTTNLVVVLYFLYQNPLPPNFLGLFFIW